MKELIIIIFLFYLFNIITKSSTISHQLSKEITQNRMFQHILTFTLLFVLISVFNKSTLSKDIIYTIFIYFWYIMSSKLDLKSSIIIISLLFIGYLHSVYFTIDETDPNIDEYTKNIHKEKYEKTKKMFVSGLIIVVIIGTLFYNNKKIEQYGGSYNICQYILG